MVISDSWTAQGFHYFSYCSDNVPDKINIINEDHVDTHFYSVAYYCLEGIQQHREVAAHTESTYRKQRQVSADAQLSFLALILGP